MDAHDGRALLAAQDELKAVKSERTVLGEEIAKQLAEEEAAAQGEIEEAGAAE